MELTLDPKNDQVLIELPYARLGQEKPNETQAPQPRADHPQASAGPSSCSPRSRLSPMSVGLGVSASTYHRWQQLYGGNEIPSEARDSRAGAREVLQAQTIVGPTQSSTRPCSRSLPRETSKPGTTPQRPLWFCQDRFPGFARRALPSGQDRTAHTQRPTSTRWLNL